MKAGTQNHVKTKRLKRLLGAPLYRVVGILETLWLLCTDCCDEGNIGKFSNEEIADYLEWDGDATQLVNALRESGWIDDCEENRLQVHDWMEHAPSYIRDRVRMRHARDTKARKQRTYVSSNPNTAEQVRTNLEHAAACHVSSKPIQTNSNPTNSNQVTDCTETGQPSRVPPKVDEPAVLEFPCDGTPNAWRLTESQIAEWQELFPSLDVLAQCRLAYAWVLADSSRRKTARGMPKFLVGWFGRSQNRGSGNGASRQPQRPSVPRIS